jgi:hypothetical protein
LDLVLGNISEKKNCARKKMHEGQKFDFAKFHAGDRKSKQQKMKGARKNSRGTNLDVHKNPQNNISFRPQTPSLTPK